MTAAQTIKTPVMVLPPRRSAADPLADMHVLARRLRRVSLGEVVAGDNRMEDSHRISSACMPVMLI